MSSSIDSSNFQNEIQIHRITSEWEAHSKFGLLGPRKCIEITFDDREGITETLCIQNIFQHFLSWIGSQLGWKNDFGQRIKLVMDNKESSSVWKKSYHQFGSLNCCKILTDTLRENIHRSPEELKANFDGIALEACKEAIAKDVIAKTVEATSKSLEIFPDSFGQSWKKFVQEKIDPAHSNFRVLLKEVSNKENELVGKCRQVSLEDLSTVSHERFSKFENKNPMINQLLNKRSNSWTELRNKIENALFIRTSADYHELIIDRKMRDDFLFEILEQHADKGYEHCLEAIQLRAKELLLKLDPKNTTFQGFLSHGAYSSDFLLSQIKPYFDLRQKEKLSESQADVLDDLNTCAECMQLFEEVEKSDLILKLKELTVRLLDADNNLKKTINESLIPSDAISEKRTAKYINIYWRVQGLLQNSSTNDLNLEHTPKKEIEKWHDQAKWILQKIQDFETKFNQRQTLEKSLIEQNGLNLSELPTNPSFSTSEKILIQSFIHKLEFKRLTTLAGLDLSEEEESDRLLISLLTKHLPSSSSPIAACIQELDQMLSKSQEALKKHQGQPDPALEQSLVRIYLCYSNFIESAQQAILERKKILAFKILRIQDNEVKFQMLEKLATLPSSEDEPSDLIASSLLTLKEIDALLEKNVKEA